MLRRPDLLIRKEVGFAKVRMAGVLTFHIVFVLLSSPCEYLGTKGRVLGCCVVDFWWERDAHMQRVHVQLDAVHSATIN